MKVSVVIPCYNVENELIRCVASIISQNIGDMEILLVDDGSTDGTPELCDKLALQYSNVKVIHQRNSGLSEARNTGLSEAIGEYIIFIDSDDYIDQGIFQKVINKMENVQADVGVYNVTRIYGEIHKKLESINTEASSSDEMLKIMMKFKGIDFYAWNKIYKRTVIKHLYFEKQVKYEDIMFNYKVSQVASKMIVTDEVGYYYVDNPASIVNQDFKIDQYDNVLERKKLLSSIKNTNPELIELAIDKLIDGYLSTGYKIAMTSDNGPFLQKLRKDILEDYYSIIHNKKTSILKKIAIQLLLFNGFMFKQAYKLYLGK